MKTKKEAFKQWWDDNKVAVVLGGTAFVLCVIRASIRRASIPEQQETSAPEEEGSILSNLVDYVITKEEGDELVASWTEEDYRQASEHYGESVEELKENVRNGGQLWD